MGWWQMYSMWQAITASYVLGPHAEAIGFDPTAVVTTARGLFRRDDPDTSLHPAFMETRAMHEVR